MLQSLSEIVKIAGRMILSARDVEQTVEEKSGPRDLVTKYDRMVQSYLQQSLSELLPGADFMGEEGENAPKSYAAEWRFIVDPIDGTTNFIQGFHNSCVSVGLMRRDQMEYGVVYNPYDGELYTAQRGCGAWLNGKPIHCPDPDLEHSLLIVGTALYYRDLTDQTLKIFNRLFPLVQDIRRFGSAALDLCYLAAGKAAAFYECRLCPWDYAAGSLIAREAGCRVSQLDGRTLDFDHKCSVLAGSPRAYSQIMELLQAERG